MIIRFAELDQDAVDYGEAGEYTRRWRVLVDDPRQALTEIRDDLRCPRKGEAHPQDLFARCYRIQIEQLSDQLLYDLTAEYSTRSQGSDNPLEERARITWETAERTVPALTDAFGRPITSTAGGLLQDVTDERSHWVLQVTKNVSAIPAWLLDYGDLQPVNSDRIQIEGVLFPARTLKLARVRIGEWQEREGIDYRSLGLTLVHSRETWDKQLLNRDLYELRLVDQFGRPQAVLPQPRPQDWRLERVPCLDLNGEPVRDPVFLDRRGRRPRVLLAGSEQPVQEPLEHPGLPEEGEADPIAEGTRQDYGDGPLKTPLDERDIVTLRFRVKAERPFARLPLR